MRTNQGRDLPVPTERDQPVPPLAPRGRTPTVALTDQEARTVEALIDLALGLADSLSAMGYMAGPLRNADELRRLRDRVRAS